MKKIVFEKLDFSKKDKTRLIICLSLLFLAVVVSAIMLIRAIAYVDVVTFNRLNEEFMYVAIIDAVLIIPSAIICNKIVKKAQIEKNPDIVMPLEEGNESEDENEE